MARKNNNVLATINNKTTAIKCVQSVQNELESVEKSAFRIAQLVAFGTGVELPSWEEVDVNGFKIKHSALKCEKPLSRKDFIDEVGRSRKTISRWMIAFDYIVKNNVYGKFASGSLPFSYDKIIIIYKEELIKNSNMTLEELMCKSVKYLDVLVDDNKKDAEAEAKAEAEAEALAEADAEADAKAEALAEAKDEDMFTITVDGLEYHVLKSALVAWLSKNKVK